MSEITGKTEKTTIFGHVFEFEVGGEPVIPIKVKILRDENVIIEQTHYLPWTSSYEDLREFKRQIVTAHSNLFEKGLNLFAEQFKIINEGD